MPIYYMVKRGNTRFSALVLEENSTRITELTDFLGKTELYTHIKDKYPDAVELPGSRFQKELESRQVHTPDMLALLWKHGDLVSQYLCDRVVYGSRSRPIDGLWASIPDAVYIQVDKGKTGYWSYVCVPQELDKETIERYELTFVSRAAIGKEIFE